MSNRHPHETKAIEALIGELGSSGRGQFVVEAEHVPVGRKNCDFLLAPVTGAGRKIAVEVVRIVDDQSEMEGHYRRGVHWAALKSELDKLKVAGVLVRTPWSVRTVPRATQGVVAPQVAQRIKAALEANPEATSVTVDGHEATRIADLPGVATSANSQVHYVNNPLLTELLLTTLEDKDAQLDLPDVERVLLAVAWDTSLDARDIVRQLARRPDLSRLRNVDQVFFLDRSGSLRRAYARDVRDFFGGRCPLPVAHLDLADQWFTTRLTENDPEVINLVRATHAARGSLDFLSRDAREALAHHGTHLVEKGRQADALWIMRLLSTDADPPLETRPSSGGICTVRGSVAWLTHRLAAAAPIAELSELVRVTETFANDSNVYVREMTSFALRVLMARMDEQAGGGLALDENLRSDIKRIWRRYVDGACADGLADAAASTLAFIFDLTEEDVEHVLNTLIDDVDAEGMRGLAHRALYFCQLRPTDPGMPKTFDGRQIRTLVRALIASNSAFRGELAFVLFRTMTDAPAIRGATAELVPFLLELGPEARSTGFALECVGMLALDRLLDPTTEEALFKTLGRATELHHHERMDLGFRLGEACAALTAADQGDRVEQWLSQIDDKELLEFIEKSRARAAAPARAPQ